MRVRAIFASSSIVWTSQIANVAFAASCPGQDFTVSTQDDIDDNLNCSNITGLEIANGQGNLTFPGLGQLYSLNLTGSSSDLTSLSFPDLVKATALFFQSAPNLTNVSMPVLDTVAWKLVIQNCPKITSVDFSQLTGVSVLSLSNMDSKEDVFNFPRLDIVEWFDLANLNWTSQCVRSTRSKSLYSVNSTNVTCTLEFGDLTDLSIVNLSYTDHSVFYGVQSISHLLLGPSLASPDYPASVWADHLTTVDSTLEITGLDDFSYVFEPIMNITTVGDLLLHDLGIQMLPGSFTGLTTANSIYLNGTISTDNDYNLFPAIQQITTNLTLEPTNTEFDCAAAASKYTNLPKINTVICYWPNGTLYDASTADTSTTGPDPSSSLSSSPSSSPPSSSSSISEGVWIAIGILSGLVVAGLLGTAVHMIRKRRRGKAQAAGSTADSNSKVAESSSGIEVRPPTAREETQGTERLEANGENMTMALDGGERFEASAPHGLMEVAEPIAEGHPHWRSELHGDSIPAEAAGYGWGDHRSRPPLSRANSC